MTTYARSEIISSSKTAKKLGQILDDLKQGRLQRAIVSKNNELEAVILPIEEYEKMMEIVELIEHLEIADLIQIRKNETAEISFDDVLKESGIGKDDL